MNKKLTLAILTAVMAILITGSVALIYAKNTRVTSVQASIKTSATQSLPSESTQFAPMAKTLISQDSSNIKLLFLGDIMLGRYVRTLMEKAHDLNYPFAKTHATTGPGANFLSGYFDSVIANLEGPVVQIPNRSQTGMSFGFAPDTAEIIKRNGIDTVTIANNHMLDQGDKGLVSTRHYLEEAGVKFFGHPILPTEQDVLIETIKGKKFGFIGFHDATRRLDDVAARTLIAKIAPQVDYTIVEIHWGIEYQKTPSKRQQTLAHAFIDAGASLIIGHHPHIPQTIETYKNAPIVYSLGNFIFDQYWSEQTQKGMTIEADFSTDPTDKSIHIIEHPIDLHHSQPSWE